MNHISKIIVVAIVFASIAITFTACNGTLRSPVGEWEYTTNPPPEKLPLPLPNDPYEVITWDGREYWGYDVDGDGKMDWMFDPERGVWYYVIFLGKDPGSDFGPVDWHDAGYYKKLIFGVDDFDNPNPPDFTLGAEYYLDQYNLWHELEIGVPFTTLGGPIIYSLNEYGEGTLEVTLNSASNWYVLPPAWYAATDGGIGRLAWEMYEVLPNDSENPSYIRTRIRGNSEVVAGYLLDMGLINVLDNHGNAVISGNPETREIYFDGEYVFDANPPLKSFRQDSNVMHLQYCSMQLPHPTM